MEDLKLHRSGEEIFLRDVCSIAIEAGKAILDFYDPKGQSDFDVKSDNSPLSQADLASHAVIAEKMNSLSSILLVSEEEEVVAAKRVEAPLHWLVDPLDGTKDFLQGRSDFTVNIALIDAGQPVLGVVYCPVSEELYSGILGGGAYKWQKRISARPPVKPYVAAASKNHSDQQTQKFLEINQIEKCLSRGSSLKFALFAEGLIDVYPRFGPTSEWDTAAGDLVAREAGGQVISLKTNQPLAYGKKNILNPPFILSRPDLSWKVPS